tara:strand:+ start:2493 stop:2729 length:237 start_codon:yes stop_codon:yes gene_type:complete
MKKLESTQNKLLPKGLRTNMFGGKSKAAPAAVEKKKADPLPSLGTQKINRGEAPLLDTPYKRKGKKPRSLIQSTLGEY